MKITKKHKELKWKEAVKLLNEIVKITLAPSPIHGVGVFALRDIKKGEKLGTDYIPNAFDLPLSKFKELKPEVKELLLSYWPQVVNGSHFLYPVTKMSAFINHAEVPNYDMTTDLATKDIKAGEEIVENYKTMQNYKKAWSWLC